VYIKEVTDKDANEFWAALDAKHPEIGKLYSNRALINGSILSFSRPIEDKNKEAIFNRYFKRWLSDNGFSEPEKDFICVTLHQNPTNSVRLIDTSTISKIDRTKENVCSVTFNDDGETKTIFITESVDFIKEQVYIF
jgi:hypothetical protein